MKKNALKLLLAVFIVLSCVGSLTGCKTNDTTTDTPSSGDCPQPTKYWDCEYTAEKEQYDINDVTLTFTYGNISDESISDFYIGYLARNGYTQEEIEDILATEEYPPILIYLYFSSFGHRYLIKTIDNFFTDEYLSNHKEEITVPAELFYNEYGLIVFRFTDSENLEDTDSMLASSAIKFNCSFYYKKDGETVYISREDLKPAYTYTSYYEEMKAKGAFPDDGAAGGFDTKQDRDDYCAAYIKVDQYGDSLFGDFYFGSVFDGREFEYVDLYFVTDDEAADRYFIKRIEDYTEDEYAVVVDRYFDYYGKEKIAGIRFSHHEVIQIPQSILTKSDGIISLYVYGKEKGKEETELLALEGIGYHYCFPDSFSDVRPYNSLNIEPASYSANEYQTIMDKEKEHNEEE